MAFFLLSGPELGPALDLCATGREGEAPLERVCGISRGPGCGTLLLYSQPCCSNYVSDLWG